MSTQSAEWIRAARVLRRSGFGARGTEIDSAVNRGDAASYVQERLGADFSIDPGVVSTPMPEFDMLERPDESDASEQRKYVKSTAKQKRHLTRWWLHRMAAAENPTNEKLTFLWHNHFATSMEKVRSAQSVANQNQKLRDQCLGDFRSLAKAMLTDAAMIFWLDGHKNKAGAPNENLAREFLELFALGHGNGYSEKDVREGARALTGWIVRKDAKAELVAKRHDNSIKTILGTTGNIGVHEFCDIAVAQPNSARYIAGRLWRQLASDNPPSDATLQRLVNAYGPRTDLKSLTTAILTDADFSEMSATVVTSPVDWLVGTLRAVQAPMTSEQTNTVARTLKLLGQLPFYPPNVGGWPSGRAWLSSSAANIRLHFASKAVEYGDVSLVTDSATNDRLDAAGYLIGVGAWSERTANALKPFRKNPAALVAAAVNTPEYLTS